MKTIPSPPVNIELYNVLAVYMKNPIIIIDSPATMPTTARSFKNLMFNLLLILVNFNIEFDLDITDIIYCRV